MRKELALALLPLVLLIGWTSGQQQLCPQDDFDNVNVTFDDARSTSVFGIELFKQMNSVFSGGNLFFSPYSIWSALTLAYFGAEGNTLAELQNVLRLRGKREAFKTHRILAFQLSGTGKIELKIANRAYLDSKLALDRCFRSNQFYDIEAADLSDPTSTARRVNDFVSKTTQGLIPRLLSPSSLQRTEFILVNAIYFKGVWEHEFGKSATRRRTFCTAKPNGCSTVPMMARPPIQTPYVNNTVLGAEVIELPYESTSPISLLLFLPWNGVRVDNVISLLNLQTLAATIKALRNQNMRVELPKFKMEQTLQKELIQVLRQMGIRDLFQLANADLSGFTRTKRVAVSDAVHKAVFDLSEEGTVAAAATAFFDTRIGGVPRPPTITFDRPFIFMIVHKELGLTLFIGVYRTPPV